MQGKYQQVKSSANAAVRGFVGINSPKIIQKLGNVGIKAVGPGLGSKVITGAASTAATVTGKVLGGANSLGAKAAKVATNAAEVAAEKGAVKKGLPALFKKIATGKVGQFILGKAVKPLGEKAFVTAMKKAGQKLSTKLTTKLAGKALTKVAGAIAKATPLVLIMMAVDFIRGMDDAYTNFRVAKGGEYKISIFQRIISGLVELVSANITFGLIPSDTIIDVFVDFLAPFFNIDVKDLQKARETAGDVMDQWNKEHPEETYNNLEDFNNRGKFWKWSNIKKSISNIFTTENKDKSKAAAGAKNAYGAGHAYQSDPENKDKSKAAAGAKNTYGAGHAYQSDPAISKMRYAGSTIDNAGCAPVAATNLLNRYRSGSMNVEDAARFAEKNGMTIPGKGTNIAYFSSFLSKNGLKTSRTSNKENVINALMKGKQVVMLGKDSNNNSTSAFGTNPHYITAIGLDKNGNIIVEDPDNPRERIRYRTKNVMNSMITSVIAGKGRSHGGGGGSFDSSTTSDTSSEETSASEESSSSGTLTTA